jgi:hypothetical protein
MFFDISGVVDQTNRAGAKCTDDPLLFDQVDDSLLLVSGLQPISSLNSKPETLNPKRYTLNRKP